MTTFIILLRGREIDRVQWDKHADAETVRAYLIRNGYHPNIDVKRSYQ